MPSREKGPSKGRNQIWNVRLGQELDTIVDRYVTRMGFSPSQALRMLIVVGLKHTNEIDDCRKYIAHELVYADLYNVIQDILNHVKNIKDRYNLDAFDKTSTERYINIPEDSTYYTHHTESEDE